MSIQLSDRPGSAERVEKGEKTRERSGGVWKRRTWQALVLFTFAAVPAFLCQLGLPPPRDRHIHVESFRYGKEPSVIRCNRGDRLHLTFSSRDTAHSFFLEEFDLDAKVTPGSSIVDVFRTSDPRQRLGPPREEVSLVAEHPGWLRYLVSKSQFRCHVWCGPMHAFEHGNLIIRPNTLLHAGLGLLVGIPVVGLLGLWFRRRGDPEAWKAGENPASGTGDGVDILRRFPRLRRLLERRGFQFTFVLAAMLPLYLAILTMLLGTKVSGRNLGVLLVWVVWLFLLTAILTPLGGRIWCLACPLPAFGEILQRGTVLGVRTGSTRGSRNRLLGWCLDWPRWLSNSWPRTIAFLTLGTFSTMLVASPRVSGWVIAGMVILATLMAAVWKGRAFCRYLCPINSFVGLYSRAGKLLLRKVDAGVCASCKPQSCEKGSAAGWGCPYGLNVGDLEGSSECGLCTECLKTCPYDNITLAWRGFARETKPGTASDAWLAMAMLVLGTTYCVVHLGHWPAVRDWVNTLDKQNWHLFGAFAAGLWFVALLGFPALLFLLSALGRRLSGVPDRSFNVLKASAGALVPLGLMVWIAFVIPMLFVHVSFVLQSISDPFGWGWHFLGDATIPWHQFLPRAVPWLQVACILVGLHYGLRNAWRIWTGLGATRRQALLGLLPLAGFLLTFTGWLLFFFAD